VPFDLGSFRKLKERSDGAKRTTYCVDVVFNALVVNLFQDDDFCNTMSNYRPWVFNLVAKRIEEGIGIKIASHKVKLVKSLRYKDGEGGDSSLPRDFTELRGENQEEEPWLPPPAPDSTDVGPLIQDMTSGRKPALKTGFLKSKDAAGSLYGPEGSKEGVLPENAGDPMGWMPKKLRQNSKIIDCNSPEYQEQERKKKAAEEANAMNKEFRDTLMEGWDKFAKKQDVWEADSPEGTEEPAACKYDVDYSRFDRIADDDDGGMRAVEERDWYYDSTGQRREINRQPTATGSRPTGESAPPAQPAVKKGFLNESKQALYPPDGSSQARPPSAPSADEVLRQFGNLMGSKPPSVNSVKSNSVAVKKVELASAEYRLEEAVDFDGLRLIVSVPGLTSMQGVNLDVTERSTSLDFPSSAGVRPLKVDLPVAVAQTSVSAKFSKKAHQITVCLPRRA